jgi:hypothetical protein
MDLQDLLQDSAPDSRLANAKALDGRGARRCNRQGWLSVITYVRTKNHSTKKLKCKPGNERCWPLIAGGATALFGFVIAQHKSTQRREPHRITKETFWGKLRELWAIRWHCQQIKLQQQKNRLLRSDEFSYRTQRLSKIMLPKRRTLGSAAQNAQFRSGT